MSSTLALPLELIELIHAQLDKPELIKCLRVCFWLHQLSARRLYHNVVVLSPYQPGPLGTLVDPTRGPMYGPHIRSLTSVVPESYHLKDCRIPILLKAVSNLTHLVLDCVDVEPEALEQLERAGIMCRTGCTGSGHQKVMEKLQSFRFYGDISWVRLLCCRRVEELALYCWSSQVHLEKACKMLSTVPGAAHLRSLSLKAHWEMGSKSVVAIIPLGSFLVNLTTLKVVQNDEGLLELLYHIVDTPASFPSLRTLELNPGHRFEFQAPYQYLAGIGSDIEACIRSSLERAKATRPLLTEIVVGNCRSTRVAADGKVQWKTASQTLRRIFDKEGENQIVAFQLKLPFNWV